MKWESTHKVAAVFAAFLFVGLFASPGNVVAQTTTLPNLDLTNEQATTSASSASINFQDKPDKEIATIKKILTSIDSLAGGYVFTTPDVFSEPVTLQDGGLINGLDTYRTLFFNISIPLYVILLLWFGIKIMTTGNVGQIRAFVLRNIVVIFLYIALAPILSYSIQFNNALTSSIMDIASRNLASPIQAQPGITTFASEYFTKGQEQINSGQSSPEDIGVPHVSTFNFFQSISDSILKTMFYLISLFALLLGLAFIAFQFYIRFITLLFLSIFLPLVIPFALLEQTEKTVSTYLKIWFTFLIHQPAFALGYGVIVLVANNILTSNGASFGLLMLYTAFLFFLGTVNVLVARIFADGWVAIGANFEAKMASSAGLAALSIPFNRAGAFLNDTKNGFLSASTGVPVSGAGASLGRFMYGKYQQRKQSSDNDNSAGGTSSGSGGHAASEPQTSINADKGNTSPSGGIVGKGATIKKDNKIYKPFSFSNEFAKNGFSTQVVDKPNGLVSMQGAGYGYYDKKHDQTYIYPTKQDAIASGLSESQITRTNLEKGKYIDLSTFGDMKHPSPHNTWATTEAKRQGLKSNYAHLTPRSSPDRINNFFSIADDRNKQLNVNGVVVKHLDNLEGNRSTRPTTKVVVKGKII